MHVAVWAIVVVIIIVVAVWWYWGQILHQPKDNNDLFTADFQPLIDDFESHSETLWFLTPRELDWELKCSKFRYRILESNGRQVYDNHPRLPSEDLSRSLEYIQAGVNGTSRLVFDLTRYYAVRVGISGPIYRVVVVSAPGLV